MQSIVGVASPKVIIIGGGIGGLTAALALLQCGIDVEVYEQSDVLDDAHQILADGFLSGIAFVRRG